MSGHQKRNKMPFYAAVRCGMIRDHPGMLRLVRLYCALSDFCMGRKETERGWILCGKKKNALLVKRCTKQKVSDSLFHPIQNRAWVQPGGLAWLLSVLGPVAA